MRLAAVVVVALAVLAVDSGRARACSIACDRVSPRPDTHDVPRNTEIVFTTRSRMESDIEPLVLRGTAGVVPIDVDTDLSTPFGRSVWRIKPKHPLAAETEYALSWAGGRVTSFRTGTHLDRDDPVAVEVEDFELALIVNDLDEVPDPCGPRDHTISRLSLASSSDIAVLHVVLENQGVRTSHLMFRDELRDFTGTCGIMSWLDAGTEYCLEISPRDFAGHVGPTTRACTTVETCIAGESHLECGEPAALAAVGTPRPGHFVSMIFATVVFVTVLAWVRRRPRAIPPASARDQLRR